MRQPRFWQLLRALAGFIGHYLTSVHLKLGKLSPQQGRQLKAVAITQLLLKLGPCFIKFGQCLSTRTDLLSAELIQEFSQLQDNLPAFDYQLVRQSIKRELGAAPEDIFAEFEQTPLASASIAQMHRARLPDGTKVAVKIQRPDLSAMFMLDLACLRRLGFFLLAKGPLKDSWLGVCEKIGETVFAEMDFLKEGRQADNLRRLLRLQTEVKIPRVYWKYSARRVLTLEYLPGNKIDRNLSGKRPDVDIKRICRQLLECYLWQVLQGEQFHGDPHSGNLAVDKHGNLIIYDFGMVGQISAAERQSLRNCIQALLSGNLPHLLQQLQALGLLEENSPQEAVIRLLKPLLQHYQGQNISAIDYKQLEQDIDLLAIKSAIRFPPSLACLLRMCTSLDGVIRSLDPNFNPVKHFAPILQKWWWESGYDLSPEIIFDWKMNRAGSNSFGRS